MPKDPVKALQCKGIIHWLRDIEGWYQATYTQEVDEAQKQECLMWFRETKLPEMCRKLEAILGDKPYFFGDKPSMADIAVVEGFMFDPIYQGSMNKIAAFQRIYDNLHKEPNLVEYYAARDKFEATPAFQHTLQSWYLPLIDQIFNHGQLRTPPLPKNLVEYDTPEAAAHANAVLRAGPRAFYNARSAPSAS